MFLKVYLADLSPLYDDEVFEKYYREAIPYRRDKVDALKLKKPKCRSLAAGILLKKALQDAGVSIESVDFKIAIGGKPELKGMESEKVFFNLSHSGDRAMCVTSDCAVGCDVEVVKENKRIASRFFTKEEAELAGESPDSFTRLWTLKESFIKATGEGLSRVVDGFGLAFDGTGKITGVIRGENTDTSFSFYEWDFEEGYKYAACVHGEINELIPEVEWIKISSGQG